MRGSPLIHCLIGAIAFALLAVPLARLTFARPPAPVSDTSLATSSKATTDRHTFIRVRFAHQPKSVSLKIGSRELVPSETKNQEAETRNHIIETETAMPIASDGLELALAVQWPDDTPDTAITVEIEPDELETRSETRWSSGARLNEILSFKW